MFHDPGPLRGKLPFGLTSLVLETTQAYSWSGGFCRRKTFHVRLLKRLLRGTADFASLLWRTRMFRFNTVFPSEHGWPSPGWKVFRELVVPLQEDSGHKSSTRCVVRYERVRSVCFRTVLPLLTAPLCKGFLGNSVPEKPWKCSFWNRFVTLLENVVSRDEYPKEKSW